MSTNTLLGTNTSLSPLTHKTHAAGRSQGRIMRSAQCVVSLISMLWLLGHVVIVKHETTTVQTQAERKQHLPLQSVNI